MDYIEAYGRTPDGKTHRSLRVDLEGRPIYAEAITEIFHPFAKGPLTSTGVQWCTELNTKVPSNEYETVEEVRCNTMLPGTIQTMELGLTGGFSAASTASSNVTYLWQARSVGKPDWIGLHAADVNAAIGTTVVEETQSGYFSRIDASGAIDDMISRVPIDFRLQIQCAVTLQGQGKTKNSSYVKITYIPD